MSKIKRVVFFTEEQVHNLELLAELRERSLSWIVCDLVDRYEAEIISAIEELE